MKRSLSLLLALLMLLSLAACGSKPREEEEAEPAERHVSRRSEQKESKKADEPTATPAVAEAPRSERVGVDPSEIPDEVLRLLGRFGWYARSDARSFRSTGEDALRLMRCGADLIVNFDSYPGPKSVYQSKADPRGRWQYCEVFDADKFEGILKTVYHFSDDAVRAIRENGEDENAGYYFLDGSYYLTEQGVGGGTVCRPLYAESDGVDLYLYYAAYDGDVMFDPAGVQYAVLSEIEMDGDPVWTLKTWSRDLPVIGQPASEEACAARMGDWVLEEDGLSSMRLSDCAEGQFQFYAGFFRLVGFDAEAQFIKGNELAVFSCSDGSEFQGWMEFSDDSVTMHVLPAPKNYGATSFDGFFDDRSFRFVRGSAVPIDEVFTISKEELEQEIERIRAVYYTPGSDDSKKVLSNGTDGWDYSREYYYHNGQLVFAFIYNGTEEHRLYFKDRHMIRYIDEDHTVYDFGVLDPFSDWEERALEEAERLFETDAVDPSAWLGTWVSDNGEWIKVSSADHNGVSFVFHHATEIGSIDTEYTLPWMSADRRSVAEDESLILSGGWRYAFYLEDGQIRVTSRYPDKVFYPET